MRTFRTTLGAILVASATFIGAAPPQSSAATPFRDIGSSPFAADIQWAYDNALTAGCTATRYCPTSVVTREQMATFLDRMFDFRTTSRDYFSDDNASQHEAAINRLAAAGVTGGCATAKYCPKQSVTREQMASFIARAAQLSMGPNRDYFSDDDRRAHEADIDRIAAAGIGRGCGRGRFCPTAAVTREQLAAFLHRAGSLRAPAQGPGEGAVLVGAGDQLQLAGG